MNNPHNPLDEPLRPTYDSRGVPTFDLTGMVTRVLMVPPVRNSPK